MTLKFLSFLLFCVFNYSVLSLRYQELVNSINMTAPEDPNDPSLTDYFTKLGVQIIKIDPTSMIRFENHAEKMMGVSDDRCDNGRVNIETDFDPKNQSWLDMKTVCYENDAFKPEVADPVLTLMAVPKRYMPIHRCMNIKLNYMERIPSIGPHRPLWARYGSYSYCPTQRWLHNVEHGAIVGLYHPCADPEQVSMLKNTIRSCLFRHVISPYPELTPERPIALVGWSASLEMSHFDTGMAKFFIKLFAKTGPERTFRDGQYRHLLVEKAQYVTNVIDGTVCPESDDTGN